MIHFAFTSWPSEVTGRVDLVVVGVSAGGMDALVQLLSPLPAEFSLPICVVQHRSADPNDYLARWLDKRCAVRVCEATMNSQFQGGLVHIAPANYHLLVEDRNGLALSVDAARHFSRPSIDLLFDSAAVVFRAGVLGIILTGANSDGTAGAAAIKRHGGTVWVQDPAGAEFAAMPSAVIKAVAVDRILGLSAFAPALTAISLCTFAHLKQ